MAVLGVDTSNYATSLALVDDAGREVVCSSKRMLPVAQGQRGLRQSDAVFLHTVALPQLLEEMRGHSRFGAAPFNAVGVSEKPRPIADSYMPCFLAGVSFAAAFAAAAGVPLVRTTHQQGHIMAARFAGGQQGFAAQRCLVFHVSGGTTELLLASGVDVERVVGQTLDLYAGQAVDRLGTRLGFGFPSGEQLSDLALTCEDPIEVKPSMKGGDASLSGLQNQCERLLEEGKPPAYVARYCLTGIAAAAAGMITAARREVGALPVLCAGGVMSSEVIRAYLLRRMEDITFVPPALSSDNAVGVALIAAAFVHLLD